MRGKTEEQFQPKRTCVIFLSFVLLLYKEATWAMTLPVQDTAEAAEVAAFLNTTANGVRREGLDTALRKYAFMALANARAHTGVIYNVSLPPFLPGIKCQAMRVRAGSARKRGLVFNEFQIPQGLIVETGGPFVFMVYRKIYNFTLYSPPQGFAFASPVIGIVIYTNLNASSALADAPLPEMNVVSPNDTAMITAQLPFQLNLPATAPAPSCVYYDINGTASVGGAASASNTCSSRVLMDVALVVPESALPPPPVMSPSPATSSSTSTPLSSKGSRGLPYAWKIALVASFGGLLGLLLVTVVIYMGFKVKDDCQISRVEEAPDDEETLQTSLIGHTRAPTAPGVRTRPVLETGSLYT